MSENENLPNMLGESTDDDLRFKEAFASAVAGTLDEEPKVVYYPGCANHVSPAKVLPEARTIFVDERAEIQAKFAQYNASNPTGQYEFYQADFHTFILPDGLRADVVLVHNIGVMTHAELDSVVAEGGIVVVNDFHDAAKYVREQCPGYTFIKLIDAGGLDDDLYVFQRSRAV